MTLSNLHQLYLVATSLNLLLIPCWIYTGNSILSHLWNTWSKNTQYSTYRMYSSHAFKIWKEKQHTCTVKPQLWLSPPSQPDISVGFNYPSIYCTVYDYTLLNALINETWMDLSKNVDIWRLRVWFCMFSGYAGFLPQFQDMHCRLSGISKLSVAQIYTCDLPCDRLVPCRGCPPSPSRLPVGYAVQKMVAGWMGGSLLL